jgi:hypothetical protein
MAHACKAVTRCCGASFTVVNYETCRDDNSKGYCEQDQIVGHVSPGNVLKLIDMCQLLAAEIIEMDIVTFHAEILKHFNN